MNKVKPTGLMGRLRAACRAFAGKPTGQISYGLELKRCSDCSRGKCEECSSLEHLRQLLDLPSCNDCGERKDCAFAPKCGEQVRINCPLWEPMEG